MKMVVFVLLKSVLLSFVLALDFAQRCYSRVMWGVSAAGCIMAAGRFDEDFVSARLKQLQLWIDRMCKHPVISRSEVFLHFLSCTDDRVLTQSLYQSVAYCHYFLVARPRRCLPLSNPVPTKLNGGLSRLHCGWRRCFVADQLWLMTRIREEEPEFLFCRIALLICLASYLRPACSHQWVFTSQLGFGRWSEWRP